MSASKALGHRGWLPPLGPRVYACLLAILCIALFVPLLPAMPGSSFDEQWAFALSQAVGQGLVFGRDIVFTYGPYASILTRIYHPATDVLMVGGSLLLALTYARCLHRVGGERRWLVLGFCGLLVPALIHHEVGFTTLIESRDALLLSVPVLVALATLRRADSPEAGFAWQGLGDDILLFSSFGVLPLIKGSHAIFCFSVGALCCAFLLARRQWQAALCSILVPASTMVLLWLWAGQPVQALPDFFAHTQELISGYSEGMGIPEGPGRQIWFVLLGMLIAMSAAVRSSGKDRLEQAVLLCVYALYFFITFKAGFVRHDVHAIIAALALVLGVAMLALFRGSAGFALAQAFAVIAWTVITVNYVMLDGGMLARNVLGTYTELLAGSAVRVFDGAAMERNFAVAVRRIGRAGGLPTLPAPSDIYSFHQASLIASGTPWTPRPVIQSFAAYTPALLELNRSYLFGPHAPHTLLFRVEPIDQRFPALEDALSWLPIVSLYRPMEPAAQVGSGFLLLERRDQALAVKEQPMVTDAVHRLGEAVSVPDGNGLRVVRIDAHLSLFGRIAQILFRPDHLRLTVDLASGERHSYRLISGIARAGFLLSPLISSTGEFAALYSNAVPAARRVRAFTVTTTHDEHAMWMPDYRVSIRSVTFDTPTVPLADAHAH